MNPILMLLLLTLCRPLLTVLGLLLAFPYIISRGLVPLLGVPGPVIQYAFICGWAAEMAIIVLAHLSTLLLTSIIGLHNSIRDERYLERRVLNNLDH